MASERLPTHDLSAVERVKREHRRDLPMGFGTSAILHASLVILFAGAAATVYVESKMPPTKEQANQPITIETLVRTPQTVVQQPQTMVRQTVAHAVTQPTSQTAAANPSLMAAQRPATQSQTDGGHLATYAILQGAAGKHHAKRHATTQDQSQAAAQAVTANSGTQAAAAGRTVYTAPAGSGNSAADDEAAAGGYMSPGQGPVWSEHPPAGPGGGTVDTCTPKRGGYFYGHHRH